MALGLESELLLPPELPILSATFAAAKYKYPSMSQEQPTPRVRDLYILKRQRNKHKRWTFFQRLIGSQRSWRGKEQEEGEKEKIGFRGRRKGQRWAVNSKVSLQGRENGCSWWPKVLGESLLGRGMELGKVTGTQ